MSKYLLMSTDTPLTQSEIKDHANQIGRFLITAKQHREAIIRGNEPNNGEMMNRFRLLTDMAMLFESKDACHIFGEFCKFQDDYTDYQKWKKMRSEQDSKLKNLGSTSASISSQLDRVNQNKQDRITQVNTTRTNPVNDSVESDAFYKLWLNKDQDTTKHSIGLANYFGGSSTLGLSDMFRTKDDEDDKQNYDDESILDDFDEEDADEYYHMVNTAYNNIERRSRICLATQGHRKFNTDIKLDNSDDNSDDNNADADEDVDVGNAGDTDKDTDEKSTAANLIELRKMIENL